MPEAFELRVVLCGHAPNDALRTLDKPGYSVCAVVAHEAQLTAVLSETQPHAVALLDDLPNIALVLKQMQACLSHTPPRIVCRAPGCELCDAVFCDVSSLPQALQTAFFKPVSALGAFSMPRRLMLAQSLLARLGMPSTLAGQQAILSAAAWLSALPQPTPPFKHWLYPLLAASQGISSGAAERRIRSAIESTWLNGSIQAQSELFGFTVSAERGKPTNAEFLFLLSEHIRRLL